MTVGDDGLKARPSILSQQLSLLPPALIAQLRKAAIEGRARRLEVLANEARQHSEDASAEILALARNFHYEALVSALGASAHENV